jgi:adenine-specific DNA-methyltransferase
MTVQVQRLAEAEPQQLDFADDAAAPLEAPAFLREQLITYIGNKRALLPFIGKGLDYVKKRLNKNRLNCLDLFSGTGVVSRYLKAHANSLVANDLELYSRITNECYLSNAEDIAKNDLDDAELFLSNYIAANMAPGFITELYAPKNEDAIDAADRVFYTRRNAMYLDTARQGIAKLPKEVQPYFLAPLIAKASIHANTSGVFKGFYKSQHGIGQYGGSGRDALSRILRDIYICQPIFSRFSCAVAVHQEDANVFVKNYSGPTFDVAYLDPPYNQHPYGSNYFMLNLLAEYKRPQAISRVSGIPVDWNRSKYNQKGEAEEALLDVINSCSSKFIMLSYNSEGFVPHEHFLSGLQKIGRLITLETPYNTFRGCRNLCDRPIHVTEFLYLLEK